MPDGEVIHDGEVVLRAVSDSSTSPSEKRSETKHLTLRS
jgi:hypothetical protein